MRSKTECSWVGSANLIVDSQANYSYGPTDTRSCCTGEVQRERPLRRVGSPTRTAYPTQATLPYRTMESPSASSSRRCRPRPAAASLPRWFAFLSLFASLLVSSAQGQSLADCSAALTAGDYDGDGLLRKVEFINFLLALSPYSPLCPDLGQVGDFLVGGFYYNVFSTASCYCLDYDDSTDCCAVPALRVPGTYADPAYVERVCTDVLAVIESSCAPPAPTAAPVANVAVRVTPSPSFTPTAAPSASATVFVDLQPIVLRGSTKRLDSWVRILLPFLGLLAVGGALLIMNYSRQRQKQRFKASKGILFGSDDGSNDYPDYPEILEATETEATETEDVTDRSVEEGALFQESKKKKKKKGSSKRKNSKRKKEAEAMRTPDKPQKKVSWNVELPPPDSPNRMSRFLETLDLEATTARPYAPAKPASPKALSTPQLSTTSKDSASDASSVDIFMDEHDDMSTSSSASNGDNITKNHIKWRLLHPTTLSGAVEVFPLPPIRNVNSLSSSSSSSHDLYQNESKEVDGSDSDSEMYVIADPEDGNVVSESSETTEWKEFQPRHPDGAQLEPDGVRLSEDWLEDNRVDGSFLV